MRKWAILILGLVVVVSLPAAPLCTSLVSQNVLTPGFQCEIANLLFSNFSAVNAGNVPNPVVNLTGAGITGSTVYLTFNPNMAPGNEPQDIYFLFQVTGAHLGADLHVGGSGASINEIVCSAPFNQWHECTGQILANLTAASGQMMTYGYYSASEVWIFKDIFVGPGGHLTNFTETFVIPEPVTLLLIGSGLLGLGLLRRRWPKA